MFNLEFNTTFYSRKVAWNNYFKSKTIDLFLTLYFSFLKMQQKKKKNCKGLIELNNLNVNPSGNGNVFL